jgi:hypothetical protein
VTDSVVAGSTRKVTAAAARLGWSSTTVIPPARAVARSQEICASSAAPTIALWRNAPMAATTSSEPFKRANRSRSDAPTTDSHLHPRQGPLRWPPSKRLPRRTRPRVARMRRQRATASRASVRTVSIHTPRTARRASLRRAATERTPRIGPHGRRLPSAERPNVGALRPSAWIPRSADRFAAWRDLHSTEPSSRHVAQVRANAALG